MNWRCRALTAVSAAIALVVVACGGAGSEDELPALVAADSQRLVIEGQAHPVSIVRIEFDREVTPLDEGIPFASSMELDVPRIDFETGEETTERVLVQEVAFVEGSSQLADLRVLDVLPEGSVLIIRGSAFVEDSEESISIEVASDFDAVTAMLATSALVPPPGLLDQGMTAEVADADRDEAAQRSALEAHFALRGATAEEAGAALEVFDTIPAEVVTSPKLRAAIAGLVGTFAEPAIAQMLTADNCTELPAALVAFQPPPDAPDLFARVTFDEEGARVFSISPVLEGERFELLIPIIAHEPVHCDRSDGRFEEVAATAFDAFLYMQLLAVDPTIGEGGTRLARELNLDAIALINSGGAVPESVGVLAANGVETALPGTTSDAASFAEVVVNAYPDIQFNESRDEATSDAYAAALAEAAGMDAGPGFDLVYLDEVMGRAMSQETLLLVAAALGLTPG